MKGYKAFDENLKCRDMQYEIGQTYKMDGEIKPCERGFHFCKSLVDCYKFYPTTETTRICKVTALGDVKTDDEIKYCTNKIKIGREVKKPREKSNISLNSSGYCNSGDWNSGDWNSGVFCTAKKTTIRIFDKDSDWTIDDWLYSDAKAVMNQCPYPYSDFIPAERMSDEEKDNHPEHKTIGGYVKVIRVTREDKQKWWDKLKDEERQSVLDLPNFDADKFYECTEIRI